MSTAGEAASLFGPTDSIVDPFATVLGDGRADLTAPLTSSDEPSGSQQSFDNAQDYSGYNSWHNAGAVDNGYGHEPPYADSNVDYANHAHQQQADERYRHSVAVPSNEQVPAQNYTAYPAYGPSSQCYDLYAPNSQTLSTTTLAQETTQQSAYDPYKPIVQLSSNNYASAVQSAYDPYKPSQSTAPKLPVASLSPPYAYTDGGRARQAPALVPAPAPPSSTSAPPYRPKTLTAYDPPIPPPKHSRYAHGATTHPYHMPALDQPTHPIQAPLSPPRKPPLRSPVMPAQPLHVSDSYAGTMAWSGGLPSTQPPQNDSWGRAPVFNDCYTPADHDKIRQLYGQNQYPPLDGSDGPTELNPLTNGVPFAGGGNAGPYFVERTMSPRSDSASAQAPPSDRVWPNRGEQSIRNAQTLHEDAREAVRPLSPPRTNSLGMNTYDPYKPNGHNSFNHVGEAAPPTDMSHQWSGVTTPGASALSPPIVSGGTVRETSGARHSSKRSKSPSGASIRSWKSSASVDTLDRLHPVQRLSSPPIGSTSRSSPPFAAAERTASPSSVKSFSGSFTSFADPYALPSKDSAVQESRSRSMSNGSAYSSPPDDPYATSRNQRQPRSDSSSQASVVSQHEGPFASDRGTTSRRPTVSHDRIGVQIVTLAPPAHTMYAPSPSLLGTNDPLGRTSVRVPVISFGFGGRLVTCFHGSSSSLHTGFDIALSSRQSTDIKLHVLHNIIPQSALDTSAAVYPGPLYADPGAPSTGLVRPGAAAQTKTKKASVMTYLDERAEEISRGIGYFHQKSPEGKKAEAKHTLMKLLKLMVENDGRLSGSPQIDAAVRAALVHHVATSHLSTDTSVDNLPQAVNVQASLPDISSLSYPALPTVPDANDPALAVNTLRLSNLEKIQELLIRGDRRAACHYASDQKLWAHAMVIASSIDKDTWKEVVTEFVRTELSSRSSGTSGGPPRLNDGSPTSSGREALRVAYSLFAGQGPTSIQELLPPKPLVGSVQTLQVPQSAAAVTPMSPNFPGGAEIMNLPFEVISKWADTAAMIISNPMTAEASSTLTALGDQLSANQWFEAAHVCYLLSPQTSPLGGFGSSGRVVLLGSPGPLSPIFAKDPDPIIFTEIAEFALSLAAPVKGQEAFGGLPHLQPYRLVRATCLAEMGHVQLANRYCEAISNSLGRNSPYINSTFIEQLKGLSDRLVAAPQTDKSGSWIGSKMSKPSLDSIGVWLEGRFTKFIAGEGDHLPRAEDTAGTAHQHSFSGPFAHYSTISSATSSTIPSPHQSKTDLRETSSTPPFRTGSVMTHWSSVTSNVQINRASSAMDYARPYMRPASPIHRVSSASAATTSFADSSPYGQPLNGHTGGDGFKQDSDQAKVDKSDIITNGSAQPQYGSWWGASESGAPTPTAWSFARTDDSSSQSSQFISLMDGPVNSFVPIAAQQPSSFESPESGPSYAEEDEDDLGLGNSGTSRAKRIVSSNEQKGEPVEDAKEDAKTPEAPKKPESQSSSSGSWFSRMWRRDSTPAPIKANLGEQTSFYYDKELKRWVNKNAGAETAKPAPPPPPPRAQTASPGRSNANFPTPPPARPATANAIDLGGQLPPRRAPPRARSNLVPTDSEGGSVPSTPMSTTIPIVPGGGPPPSPAGRARAQIKRAVRSRYVDVFQQQAENA